VPEHRVEIKGRFIDVRVKFVEPDLPYSPEGCGFCEVMPPNHRPNCPAYEQPKWYRRLAKAIRNFFLEGARTWE
jgi:hypothetical protein